MFNLLSVFGVINDTASKTFIAINIIVAVVLIFMLVAFSFRKKTFETKTLIFAGLMIATSFVLSTIKIKLFQAGGSITICSMLAIAIYAYAFGFLPALFVGIIYGILQFFEGGAYIYNLTTFFLDFIFAFSSIIMMPLARKFIKGKNSFIVGLSLTFAFRFIFHFISGIFYYPNLPLDAAIISSISYQATYLVPDYLICLIVSLILKKNNTLDKLVNLIER